MIGLTPDGKVDLPYFRAATRLDRLAALVLSLSIIYGWTGLAWAAGLFHLYDFVILIMLVAHIVKKMMDGVSENPFDDLEPTHWSRRVVANFGTVLFFIIIPLVYVVRPLNEMWVATWWTYAGVAVVLEVLNIVFPTRFKQPT